MILETWIRWCGAAIAYLALGVMLYGIWRGARRPAGSLMLYRTWTTAAYAFFAPLLIFRARREEQTLAAEFGEAWQTYTARAPMILPCWKRKWDAE